MQLIYNELSALPLCESRHIANNKMEHFIRTFARARDSRFRRIRFSQQLHEIDLADGYSMYQWLSETNQRTMKELLLGAFRYPFIADTDDQEVNQYIIYSYYFEDSDNGLERTDCLGLAAAHIYDTLSISHLGSDSWETNSLTISKVNDETNTAEMVQVINVFSPDCFDRPHVQDYITNISEVELVETDLLPRNKRIHLRDDHGSDVLERFANRLVNSHHIVAIINSLPFNSRATEFIRRVFSDGRIELVLFREDRGLGLVVQTTGRNMRETNQIAELLKDRYY